MSKATQIEAILMEALEVVYCDTCKSEQCEECARKSMGWGISREYAESVTNSILEVSNE